MLVLSRRTGESVAIGDDVVVTVLEVRGDVIRMGIEAPRSVTVHRAEVVAQLQDTNREAVSPTDDAVRSVRRALRGKEVGDRDAPA